MNVTELITSKLDGLISTDLLKTIERTVQRYENQKLASANSDGSKEWTLWGNAEVMTWVAARNRDELMEMVQGIQDDPNSVEWWVEEMEGVELHHAMADDEEDVIDFQPERCIDGNNPTSQARPRSEVV
jgi:hypothetical protein